MRIGRKSFAASLVLLALLGCGRGESEGGEEGVPAVVDARTGVASLQAVEQTVAAIGTVVPRPGSFAQLAPPASARVARVYVVGGERVAAGAPLVEFEHGPFDAALHSAEAEVISAQHAYDRAVRLADEGILPRKDVDQAATDLAQAQASLGTARRSQELSTLRAPIAGVVTRMTAVMGSSVEPGTPLVEVADPSALDIVLNVSPSDAALVRAGATVAFAAGERPGGEQLGTGAVSTVGASVDSATRVVAIHARLARPSRPLRIGESVFGTILVATHPRAITVPIEALVPEGEGYKVFVVDSAGIAHGRPVTVGVRTATVAEILVGLAAGEAVVTYGAYGMEDSARVRAASPR
jgi:RND family efflux transporter MFP subunit